MKNSYCVQCVRLMGYSLSCTMVIIQYKTHDTNAIIIYQSQYTIVRFNVSLNADKYDLIEQILITDTSLTQSLVHVDQAWYIILLILWSMVLIPSNNRNTFLRGHSIFQFVEGQLCMYTVDIASLRHLGSLLCQNYHCSYSNYDNEQVFPRLIQYVVHILYIYRVLKLYVQCSPGYIHVAVSIVHKVNS